MGLGTRIALNLGMSSKFFSTFRSKVNQRVEKQLYRGLEKLEKIPPINSLIAKLPRLKWAAIGIAGFFVADLLIQALVAFFLSVPAKPLAPRTVVESPYLKSRSSYEGIITRNAFCPGCVVPDMKLRSIERPKDCSRASIIANSSIKIIGTIVLSDPKYSVATLSTGTGESIAVKPGDAFQEMGKVFEIRKNRICFVDDNGILHAVDLPEENAIQFGQPVASALPTSNFEGIARTSDTDFEIKRDFLLDKLNDPNLLFQAKAVPYKENGQVKGFKILSIVPGSVYESLGLQVNDIITGVNGEAMDSVLRAQELYNAANSAKEVNLEILRNGTPTAFKFQVK